jgi:hypothetical protein
MWTALETAPRPQDAPMRPDEPDPGELRRPDLLLHAVAGYEPFSSPRTLLARVDGAYEQQVLAGVTGLWDEPPEHELDTTRQTEQALQRLGFVSTGRRYRDWPMAVPIVIRPGPSWFSWDESEAVLGLRYGSNLCDVVQGDVLTVTPRGWSSWPADLYGGQPRAQWQAAFPERPGPADQLAQLEASLAASSQQLTAPLPDECLLHYLERMLSEFGCVGHRFTERWAQGRKVRGRPVMVWARATGGCCCDCEVVMNSLGRRSTRRRGLLCREAIAELEAQDGQRW